MCRLSSDEVARLLEDAGNGDRAAFDRVVKAYNKALVRFINTNIWSGSLDDAEEIAIEVWAKIWTDICAAHEARMYNADRGSFYTFITTGRAVNLIRRWNKRFAVLSQLVDPDIDVEQLSNILPSGKPSPEDISLYKEMLQRRYRTYLELLRLVFLCGGYPHQQLAFGFSKLIHGELTPRGLDGRPTVVAEQYGDSVLRDLVGDFKHEYHQSSGIGLQVLTSLLEPVRVRCDLKLGELMQGDPESLGLFPLLLQEVVGDTRLAEYFGDRGAAASISDWCYGVERRVRTVMGLPVGTSECELLEKFETNDDSDQAEHAACSRCKLRWVAPCILES